VAGPKHAPLPQEGLADARRHLDIAAASESEEARRYLGAQVRVAGDSGDGGQVYFGVTESKGEGKGVINVRADVSVEDDSMGQDP
jgi:hypothetical protein